MKRRRKRLRGGPRDLLLFVRPARPGPSWPRAAVGDLRWAGVMRDGMGWLHDAAGDPMNRQEIVQARFGLRFGGALPWAVFRVVKVKQ